MVFGRVLDVAGMEVVRAVEAVKVDAKDKPVLCVEILECGEF